MAAVNEWVVREYFESQGYLVSQPRKYVVPGRQKKPDEEIDLIILNPRVSEHIVPTDMVWSTQDLASVSCAVIGIRGWHTERFYVSTFEQTPDILRFAEPESVKFAGKLLGTENMAKILCLPKLPASGELKKKTIQVLKDKGVDGVISFQTILLELVRLVETKRNYEKSDLLQIIRLLKNYDLLKDDQLELFDKQPAEAASSRYHWLGRKCDMTEDRQSLIAELNKDLEWEYAAAVQYVQHASVISGAQYEGIQKELIVHANEELQHAIMVAEQVDFLGGVPSIDVEARDVAEDALTMLKQDLAGEENAIVRYKARIAQAEKLQEYGLRRVIEDILIQEEEHKRDLLTAIEV